MDRQGLTGGIQPADRVPVSARVAGPLPGVKRGSFRSRLQERQAGRDRQAGSDDLPGATAMSVEMELSRIIISEINDQQVVYLKEVDGDRTFPILIGLFEATSIDRRVKHHQSPRPLTHDLLVAAVELMGGEFQDVVISEIKEHTYYAVIRVAKDGDVVEIDARPSDAIAVAVTCEPNLPIYVAEEVLENVLG
jgi:bifunctional DNase/RNase